MNDTKVPEKKRPQGLLLPVVERFIRIGAIVSMLLVGIFAAGFLWFATQVPRTQPAMPDRADAVVALTGGAERISEAVDILAAGRAQRLLISGVNPDTRPREIARLHPRAERWIECCIDLGRLALNTAGNAIETRQWVHGRGFKRIIVVTSGWHMPRTLVELGREMPDVELVPYPVITSGDGREDWWASPRSLRLLLSEYVKYLAALVEIRFAPRVARNQPAPSGG